VRSVVEKVSRITVEIIDDESGESREEVFSAVDIQNRTNLSERQESGINSTRTLSALRKRRMELARKSVENSTRMLDDVLKESLTDEEKHEEILKNARRIKDSIDENTERFRRIVERAKQRKAGHK
jgi:hypothetical protein